MRREKREAGLTKGGRKNKLIERKRENQRQG